MKSRKNSGYSARPIEKRRFSRTEKKTPQFKETKAVVLDYYENGMINETNPSLKDCPTLFALGYQYFVLIKIVFKENSQLEVKLGDWFPVVPSPAPIKKFSRIKFEDLPTLARGQVLLEAIELIVEAREKEFVDFFNTSGVLTLQMHKLELLKGIGKKRLEHILRERERKPFSSFEDIKERTEIPDPKKLIAERIYEELQGGQRHYLFVPWQHPHRG